MNYDDLTPEELAIIQLLEGKTRQEVDQILGELERKLRNEN